MELGDSKKHGSYAIEYDEMTRSMEWHGHEALFGMVFEYADPGQNLLDIGIGTGLSAFLFHKAGLEVYGVDYSEDMLRICDGKKIAKELKVYDISGDNWPYRDEEFDNVISCGVFHFAGDLDTAFTEVHRILKTDGIFSFTFTFLKKMAIETYNDPDRRERSGFIIYVLKKKPI
jgi:ubiquinone/menaquinone biosynthesis C-methylase UbiE